MYVHFLKSGKALSGIRLDSVNTGRFGAPNDTIKARYLEGRDVHLSDTEDRSRRERLELTLQIYLRLEVPRKPIERELAKRIQELIKDKRIQYIPIPGRYIPGYMHRGSLNSSHAPLYT